MTVSAAPVNSVRVEPQSLHSIAANVQREIDDLSSSLAAAQARKAQLSSERSSLILPARSGKDKDAQDRLRTIDEELSALSRDISDDEFAVASLRSQLESLQHDIVQAEWEERRQALVKQLDPASRKNTFRKFVAALDEVKRLASEIKRENDEAAQAVVEFDPRLKYESNDIRRFNTGLADFVDAMLFEIVPTHASLTAHTRRAILGTDRGTQRSELFASVIREIQALDMKV